MKLSELSLFENHPAIEEAIEELIGRGVLERVELGSPDERLWTDCDLAIFAEHRLGDRTDPRALDAARRTEWLARATTHPPSRPSKRSYNHCLWLRDGAERVGIVALARSTLGGTLASLSSLYVLPDGRRRGLARRGLLGIRDALADRDLGLRLDTCWAWQGALRTYLRLGAWVRMWKRDLALHWVVGAPVLTIDVGEEISMSITVDGTAVRLWRARRDGDRLVLEGLEEHECPEPVRSLVWEARSTFALVLAVNGWPLVRSPEQWQEARYSDLGPPEALADRIRTWEAWDRDHRWIVDTPRIPGLAYPTWAELQAEWAAPDAE